MTTDHARSARRLASRAVSISAVMLASIDCASLSERASVSAMSQESRATVREAFSTTSHRSVYAVLVGIGDYGGSMPTLAGVPALVTQLSTSLSTTQLSDTERQTVLLDDHATQRAVVEALGHAALSMQNADTLLFVFDGHAGPSGIAVYDGIFAVDRIAQALDAIPGHVIVVINGCQSGSLRSLIDGRAGRLGIFSSRGTQLTYGSSVIEWLDRAITHLTRSPDGSVSARTLGDMVGVYFAFERRPPTQYDFGAAEPVVAENRDLIDDHPRVHRPIVVRGDADHDFSLQGNTDFTPAPEPDRGRIRDVFASLVASSPGSVPPVPIATRPPLFPPRRLRY